MMINNLTRRQTHEWQWWYTRIWVLGWTQGYASKWKKMFCLYECFPNVCFLWVFCLSQKSFFFRSSWIPTNIFKKKLYSTILSNDGIFYSYLVISLTFLPIICKSPRTKNSGPILLVQYQELNSFQKGTFFIERCAFWASGIDIRNQNKCSS